ncbi:MULTISPECIES: peptide ABC transporter substrate-binding protein [Cysteiniphilum]|uniref:Oligopeptide ABC transporter substrate-binding protein OppA n=1 Tax=Cysteiniphilum litorale TaxID=2056700 RepID=A0A8J3E9R0_9GAMM|nr:MULTISPECIES: peptide ABC transporter substrate-binding protein [Cysteiniphilum]GGG05554.1 oligopeptide ABC transporter substrate-binding protein OppA [Cysteiniphilum litorale]
MKQSKLIPSLLLSALFIAGCGGSNSQTSNKSLDQVAPKGKDTFVRANAAEPDSLDPAHAQDVYSTNIMYDIGEGLMSENQKNEPVPGVAKSYKVSKDGLTYTFYLRDNAKWSNGKPVTAEDFAYALKRAVNPQTASEMAYKLAPIQNAQAIMDGKKPVSSLGVKVINAHEIEITLDYPVYYFLSIMADPVTYPVYKAGVEQYGKGFFQAGKLISNGPYELKEWVPNGYVLVTKNPYYWDAEHVKIQNVKFLPIVDRSSALNAYASGQVDYVQYVPTVSLDVLKKRYGTELQSTPWLTLDYLDFNMTKPPFKDNKDLREALSLAIDRVALAKNVVNDGSVPAYSLFPADIDGGRYKNVIYAWHDWSQEKRIDLAKELYKKAGYSADNPLVVSLDYNTDGRLKKLMEAISQMWAQNLGVKVNLANSEFKVFLKLRQSHSYEGVARDGWVADFDTIDNFANMWMCTNPQNNAGYCNAEYDKLITQGQKQLTADSAIPYYTKALDLMQNDYPSTPLIVQPVVHLVKPYVVGYEIQNNHLDHFYDKWLSFKYQA